MIFVEGVRGFGFFEDGVVVCSGECFVWVGLCFEVLVVLFESMLFEEFWGCLIIFVWIDCYIYLVYVGSRVVEFE